MATKKNTKQKSSNNRPKIRPFWVFVALFGLVGGIWLYRSFAAVSAPQVYLTTNNNSSSATIPDKNGFTYGAAGDKIIACDWDGVAYGPTNGATVAAYRPSNSSFYISNNNASVNAGNSFQFGDANGGYIPVCGNWDGQNPDGQSAATVGLYNPKTATFSLASKNIQGGNSTEEFVLGIPGDVPIACDWNGDKITDLGLFRPSEGKFYLALKYQGKWGVFNSFRFGNAGLTDYPVCGNWNGKASTTTNEFSTVGVYRTTDAKFYLRNFNSEGPVDVATASAYGEVNSFVPVVGNWTGTNQTFIGAYRPGNNAPTAPTNLKVNSASTSGVSLSWGAASDDGGSIAKYEIYKNGTWLSTTTKNTYTDTKISANIEYTYYVIALDNMDTRGPQSNYVKAKVSSQPQQPQTEPKSSDQQSSAIPRIIPGIPAGCAGGPTGPKAPNVVCPCEEKNLQIGYYETLIGQIGGARTTILEGAQLVGVEKYDWYTAFKDSTARDIANATEQNRVVRAACERNDSYGTLTAIAARKLYVQDVINRIYLRAQQVCVDLTNLPRSVVLNNHKESKV